MTDPMPADLTPVQALDEIRAICPDGLDDNHSDVCDGGLEHDLIVKVRAILVRVTPTETPTPTAVPGTEETERVARAITDALVLTYTATGNELQPIDTEALARAAITALQGNTPA